MSKVTIERAHRMDGTGEYYFSRRLREIAEIEATTGRQIIKLAMGSPDLPPHPSVIERLSKEALRPDVHKYMSFKGEPVLRKAFADWYGKWYGVEVDYNTEVLPLIGSKEGIMHICQTFVNPGDKVLVPNPGYAAYKAAVTMTGGVMLPYSLNKENGFKVAAAEQIAADLSRHDLQITVKALPWSQYLQTLQAGNYDLYYGEVRLTADWDLRSLIGTGGSVNYCGYSDAETDRLLDEYLRVDDGTRSSAMLALCQHLQQQAPILPICFKSVSVLLPSGAVESITPTAANPFYDLPDWEIHMAK